MIFERGVPLQATADGRVKVAVDATRAPWRLRAHPSPAPVAGWCILDLVRPAATLDELSPEESRELGVLLSAVTAAMRRATGCQRAYVFSFAEALRQVHLHVAPRHESDPRTQGWAVADLYREVQSGRVAPADPAAHEKTFAMIAKVFGDMQAE